LFLLGVDHINFHFSLIGADTICLASASGTTYNSDVTIGDLGKLYIYGIILLASLVAGRGDPSVLLVQCSRECTPSDLSTGISNLLQPAQEKVVLSQLSTYLVSWDTIPWLLDAVFNRIPGQLGHM
jgi:hypothetical protein